MDIETSNQKFKLEYAIDKTNNWQPIDNLLLNDSKCLNQIEFKFLIDSFLLSSLNYCEKNTGTKECRQFYNNLGNLENNIIDYYNDLGKISKYPNTIDGKYGDWSINDSVWNSIDVNIVGNCGKGIVRQRVRNYEDALYGGDPNYGAKLDSYVESSGPFKTEKKTQDIYCQSEELLTSEWKKLGCNANIDNNLNELRFKQKSEFLSQLNTWSLSNLTNSPIIQNISKCYNDYNNQVSSLLLNNDHQKNNLVNFPDKSTIYPNICYNNNYEWINGNFKLIMQTDGNLVLFSINLNKILWSSNTAGNNNARLCMQRDGNLVIYNINNQPIWASGTDNIDNTGNYFRLSESGQITMISFIVVVKCLNLITLDNIKDYYNTYGKFLEFYGGMESCLNDRKIIYQYIKYSNNFTWINNNHKLIIQNDGNLVIYSPNNEVLGSSDTFNNKNAYIVTSNDGGLYVYNSSGIIIKKYGEYITTEFNINIINSQIITNFKYFELSSTGYIILINNNNNLLDILLNKNIYSDKLNTIQTIRNNLINEYRRITLKPFNIKNKCLDINNGNIGNQVQIWDCNNTNAQKFIYDINKQTIHIANNSNPDYNKCFDIPGANPWNGNKIQVFTCNNTDAQKFIYDNNTQQFKSKINNNKCLDLSKGETWNGNKIQIWDCDNNTINQKFNINYTNSEFNTNVNSLIKTYYSTEYIDKPLKDLITKYGQYNWSNEWKDNILGILPFISNFTNKLSFSNKLNNSIIENFQSDKECDISNILVDPNCNTTELNIYKNYIKNMNQFCKVESNIINNEDCINYQNKLYSSDTNNSLKFDTSGKLSLLKKQEDLCINSENYINDVCIPINANKSRILKEQAEFCSNIENEKICNKLNEEYSILDKLSNISGQENGKLNFQDYKLFTKCKENNNNYILNDKCINLINNQYLDESLKDELSQIKKDTCTNPENYIDDNCINDNLNNKDSLNIITNYCKQNKNDINCKKFCEKNKENIKFKDTEFYEEICQPWHEKYLWLIILIIVFVFLGSGIIFNNRKKINTRLNFNRRR
jgi:hypothetical protein